MALRLPVRFAVQILADVRFAARTLRRNIGFALSVILVLGAGIGAATAVFVVTHRVLLEPLPYPDSERLVQVFEKYSPTNLGTICAVDIRAIGEQQRTLEAFGVVRPGGASLVAGRYVEYIVVGRATSGFFKALRIEPMFGRLLEPKDDLHGAPPAIVLSYALAQRVFGSAADAVGKSIAIDGTPVQVVGVLGRDRGRLAGIRADAWPALQLATPTRRGPFGYRGIARLSKGVTLEQATSDLAAISERIFPIWKSSFQDSNARLTPVPLRIAIGRPAGRQVVLFGVAVALVLLLGIANVGTLMLVRTSAREQEFGIRSALGAARGKVARLIVTECLLLTVLSGIVAIAVAAFGLRLVHVVAPALPRLDEVALDGSSAAFAVALVLISGLLISLAPVTVAFSRGASAAAPLGGGAARSGSGRSANRTRSAIVVAEFALALPLVVGAALLFNSFLRLQHLDPGFDPKGVYGARIPLATGRYPTDDALRSFWRRLEIRLRDDGVGDVALSSGLPPDTFGDVNNFDLLDKPVSPGASQPTAPWLSVSPQLFATLRIPLLQGRFFTNDDSANAPPAVIVSRSWAAKYYPSENAVGKQLRSGGCTTCPPATIVGIVGDVPFRGLAGEEDAVYVPLEQEPSPSMYVIVRGRLGRQATMQIIRSEVAALDSTVAEVEVAMGDRLRDALGDPGRWAAVVGSFAAAGAMLAALGIFGLMSYVVRQRHREIGVRLALGATQEELTRLIVLRGMRYALAGALIGVAISAIESRWLGALLFGVRPADPPTIVISVVVLLIVAAIACVIPAIRAGRISPVDALRDV
ncbi:MAG TPA: ADOP family duplicated permease [Thermoanaerobaculia bacterium]|nr:ADOP family duplicated permease [Thermoanaerobaculia bacterium]